MSLVGMLAALATVLQTLRHTLDTFDLQESFLLASSGKAWPALHWVVLCIQLALSIDK